MERWKNVQNRRKNFLGGGEEGDCQEWDGGEAIKRKERAHRIKSHAGLFFFLFFPSFRLYYGCLSN